MDDRYFPQFLLNRGAITVKEAVELLSDNLKGDTNVYAENFAAQYSAFKGANESPVREVIMQLADEELATVAAVYADYMQLFVESMAKYMSTLPIIDPKSVKIREPSPARHIVSQGMGGDVALVPSIMADDDVFLSLAERMSGEKFKEVDELAIDSLQEFINVVNGIFSVNMAGRGLEVELETPRQKKITSPAADLLMELELYADVGRFYVVMAADDFI